MRVDPADGRFDVRPEAPHQIQIHSSLRVFTGKQHKQRCRIDTAVITTEGHFVQAGHLAAARLMNDLSGLRVIGRIDGLCLKCGQSTENTLCNRWHAPQ